MTDALVAYQATGKDVLERKSKSFSLASRLLPTAAREATIALYAFCRRCDDAVDAEGKSAAHAQAAVARLRRELDSVYAGQAQPEAVLAAFQAVVVRYAIPRLYPEELLAGMAMDAEEARYETLPELLLYCHRVAGTVGLMMCHVMGVSDARALRNAAHLGIAMQLTNICRDVLEDFRMGRVYLPRTLLGELAPRVVPGGDAAALFAPEVRGALARVVRSLLDEARGYYRSGDRGLFALPFRAAVAVRAASLIYAAIGTRLRLVGCDALRGRVVTPRWWKVALVGQALLESLAWAPRRALKVLFPSRPSTLQPVRFEDVLSR